MKGQNGMQFRELVLWLAVSTGVAAAQIPNCNMQNYKPVEGMQVKQTGNSLSLTWQGKDNDQLKAEFTIRGGQPVVEELEARTANGQWAVLGKNLTPYFQVTTGKRRMDTLIQNMMIAQGRYTPGAADFERWDTFWDAPLAVPGTHGQEDMPRLRSEIKRAAVTYNTNGCTVTSEGERVSVAFNGLTLGIFSGYLQFTAFKGSNLLRQEAIAKTEVPRTAFKYEGGLNGFAITNQSTVYWRDLAQEWQQYSFEGAPNTAPQEWNQYGFEGAASKPEPVELKARNRLLVLGQGTGSLAVFPPPHKFFFAREEYTNLGYVYYRKDSDTSFSIGVMQPDTTSGHPVWGDTQAEWQKQEQESWSEHQNFALYNAPAGTEQHMAVFYLLSPEGVHATQAAVLAYTHGDVFKPVPGFKVITGHFHFRFNEMLRDSHNLNLMPDWVPGYRALGINIIYLGDFHDDSNPRDPGPIRFAEQKVYFEGAQRLSDKNFLVIPAEEANSFLGGHWYMISPKPIYFSHAMPDPAFPQPFEKVNPVYGTVYHLSSAADVLKYIDQTNSLIWAAHPRTKGSEGYPDLYKTKDFFLSDRFIGASWENLPTDLSEKTMCPYRCFDTEDSMSNWAPKPKFMIAEGDVYWGAPNEESIEYSQLAVNYIKLDRVPLYNQSWAPIIDAMRAGDFFGTTGEILFHNWGIEGSGANRTYDATIEYTYPLDFAELVWGNGKTVGRKVVNLKNTTAFGTKTFKIPFDATGKKWVRFSVWDSAGDGAWANPIQIK